jgi:hypothetical protein
MARSCRRDRAPSLDGFRMGRAPQPRIAKHGVGATLTPKACNRDRIGGSGRLPCADCGPRVQWIATFADAAKERPRPNPGESRLSRPHPLGRTSVSHGEVCARVDPNGLNRHNDHATRQGSNLRYEGGS